MKTLSFSELKMHRTTIGLELKQIDLELALYYFTEWKCTGSPTDEQSMWFKLITWTSYGYCPSTGRYLAHEDHV